MQCINHYPPITSTTTHVVSGQVAASLLNPATAKDQPLMGLHSLPSVYPGLRHIVP